jgi:hypothetical protein
MELVQEKQQLLSGVMPELEALYRQTPSEQQVLVYRGIEGWKNYMRDIIRVGEDFYCIGAKGAWMDARLKHFFPKFMREATRSGIDYFHLFDYEVKQLSHEITQHVGEKYKFLPPNYSTANAVDVFGPHVNILSNIYVGGVHETDFTMTVIVNRQIADAFRTWFRFMYDFCPEAVD